MKSIMYAIDVSSKNIARSVGFGYFDNSVSVPIYFTMPLLADYFTIGANVNLNANIISLNNIDGQVSSQNRNSSYFGATYGLSINSDVAKQYDKIFHTMGFKASFSSPLYQYFNDENNVFNPSTAGRYGRLSDIATTQQQIELSFSQYFFGLNGIELLYHRIYQSIYPQNGSGNEKLDSLRNELGFAPIDNIDIMTTIYYSHLSKNVEEASISFSARYAYFKGSLTYFLKKKFQYTNYTNTDKYTEETANFLRVKLSNDFGYFALYGDIGYDFKLRYLRDWNIVISKDIRCFGVGLRFANEIVPILTTTGTRTLHNRYVSLEFRFVPVTATSFSYEF